MERDFSHLSEEHKKRLKYSPEERVDKLKKAIFENYLFLLKIVQPHSHMFKFFKSENGALFIEPLAVSAKNIVKMRSTLKLFIRDWSKEGQEERDMCYKPILEEFKKYFPETRNSNDEMISVLIPGAGLGRLLYEFAKAGYKAQGNEFSYFMLLASNFILNCSTKEEEFEIKPLIHTFSNVFLNDGPFKTIKIPDEVLNMGNGDMSMVAGEFVEVYKKQKEAWDSVVTCFFIDTAHNIIEYVETIYNMLKKGGVWINLGPLLYHYTDLAAEVSIELSWEELKHVIINMGFEIKNESVKECYYSSDIDSMLKTVYKCIFFTAVKL